MSAGYVQAKCGRNADRHDARDMPKRNGWGIALLADPTRRRIIALLALRPMRPSVIAREIGRSRPATSRQLRLLSDAGLIRPLPSPHDGRSALYGLDPRRHGQITAWLAGTEIGLDDQARRSVAPICPDVAREPDRGDT